MGGFVLDDDNGKPGRTLCLEEIEELVRNDEIQYPIITKAEIKDKSKGDVVTKGLVLIQTTWFLLQCVARAKKHLALTELEVATAAFAFLNSITYALWWDKPLNVKCPIRVRKKHLCGQQAGEQGAGSEQGATDVYDEELATEVGVVEVSRRRGFWRNVCSAVKTVFLVIFSPFRSMVAEDNDDHTFFAGKNENNVVYLGAAVVVATVFGGIHCIAWSFSFPSPMEQRLWRASSIVITATPMAIQGSMSALLVESGPKPGLADLITYSILLYPLSIVYFLARITLLVLSLMALRLLPPSALQAVHWTTFLPHV